MWRATGLTIDWRFISLRLLNKDKDYATEFPPEHEQATRRAALPSPHIRAELGPDRWAAGRRLRGKLVDLNPKRRQKPGRIS